MNFNQIPFALMTLFSLSGGAPALAGNPCSPPAANPCGAGNPCSPPAANPCGAGNPCSPPAANPCGAGNPCSPPAANPCGAGNPCSPPAANPCGAGNPCSPPAANPCGAGNPCAGAQMDPIDPALFSRPAGAVLAKGKAKRGEKLWSDTSISPAGVSCATCHVNTGSGPYAMMKPSFAQPYPHSVAMSVARAGKDSIEAAEMVNFCMIVPMKAAPLAWDSKELADLTAYVESVQAGYVAPSTGGGAMSNPCNPCNPCGAH